MLRRAKAGLSACVLAALAGWSHASLAPEAAPDPIERWTEPRLGIELVAIPPGEFDMGSPLGEPMREAQERQHRVRLTKGFSLARHEVTQELWARIMGSNPSHFKECPRCPAERVSFLEVSVFLARVNAQAADARFRLPTEAEWEYACRAGGTAAFGGRATIDPDAANYNSEYPMPGGRKAAARGRTVAVGSFPPNAWSLFDMHGNVWEWTSDWHCAYPAGPVSDPAGECVSQYRVIRGGSWHFDAASARCALRYTHRPQDSGFSLGFRLAHDRAPR
jgi:formylglycine-generating enzyme required for sulfatase activity